MEKEYYHDLRKLEIQMIEYVRQSLDKRNYDQVKYWGEKLIQLDSKRNEKR